MLSALVGGDFRHVAAFGACAGIKLRSFGRIVTLMLMASLGIAPGAVAQSPQEWKAAEIVGTFPSQSAALAAVHARGGRYALAEQLKSVYHDSKAISFNYTANPRPPIVGEWSYTGNGVDPGPVSSAEEAARLTLANFQAKSPQCGVKSIELVQDWTTYRSALGMPQYEYRNLKMESTSPTMCSRTFVVQHYRERVVECPKYLSWNGKECFSGVLATIYSNSIPCDPCDLRGNPISVVSGSKVQSETDFSLGWLEFYRTFDSSYRALGSIGRDWMHSLNMRLYSASGGGVKALVMPTGSIISFNGSEAIDGSGAVLKVDGDGYVAFLESGRYRFNGAGRLSRIERYSGDSVDIEFDSSQRIVRVAHSTGRELEFGYNSGSSYGEAELAYVKDQSGILVAYTYDLDGRLTDATYRGGAVRRYLYEHPKYKRLLTGIEDESSARLTTYTYNDEGLAIASEHAGGVQKHTFDYQGDGTTVHTNPLGGIERVALSSAAPYRKITEITTQRGTQSWQYAPLTGTGADFRRRVIRRQDAGGAIDLYAYRNLADPVLGDVWIKRSTEASNRPEQRVTEVWRKRDTNQIVRMVVPANTTTWLRNDRGQVVDQTVTLSDGQARTTTYRYCEQAGVIARSCPVPGLLLAADGPLPGTSDTVSFVYYPEDAPQCAATGAACLYRKGDLWKVINALGDYTEVLAYDGAGRPQTVMDPNGVVTDYQYSPRGWLTTMTVKGETAAEDRATNVAYLPSGLVEKVTAPDGAVATYTYDAAQRLVAVGDGMGNSINYTLDNAGNRIAEETHGTGGEVTRSLSRIYDQLSQLVTLADASGNPTDLTYDPNGNVATVTDALGRVSKREYDAFGRLKRTLEDANGIAAETQLGYDSEDNLLRVIDPKGLPTTYGYNGFGDFTSQRSPDTGGTSLTVDAAGNTRTRTDARGVTTTYTYDVLNRLTGTSYPDSTLNVSYSYDIAPAVCDSSERFAKGRVGQVSHAGGATAYCYDRFGQVTRKVQTVNGVSNTLRYAYAKSGKLATLVYPDGSVADYVRDALGRISEIGLVRPGQARQIIIHHVTYAPFGPPTGWTYGNGRRLERPLDQDYRPQAVHDAAPGGLSLAFGYDPVGKVTELNDGTGAKKLARYTYDALGRLTQTQDGPSGTPIETYAYDATGNRTSLTTASGTVAYIYPLDSHLLAAVGGVERDYDSAGNTVSLDGKELIYSDANRMGQVKEFGQVSESYQYDHLGGRVLRTPKDGAPVITIYDEASQWLGNFEASGQPVQQAIWMDDYPVALTSATASGTSGLSFVQPDHMGTPRVVIDSVRQLAVWEWSSKSEVFGNQVANSDPDGDGSAYDLALRFPGQQATGASGLFYNQQRDYEPSTGRYSQSDPMGLGGGLSTYSYVKGNPVSFYDPLGLQAVSHCPDVRGNCPCATYGERYMEHLDEYLINVGPYASALAGGLWPKSLAPATGGRRALLGSKNPLTSVPRGFGVPGAGSSAMRAGAAGIGVFTVAIGFYNVGVFGSGLAYAAPSYCTCD